MSRNREISIDGVLGPSLSLHTQSSPHAFLMITFDSRSNQTSDRSRSLDVYESVCVSHSCTSSSTRLSSPTCILQLQSSPSPYHSGQFGDRITPPGPVRSPPHCAAEGEDDRLKNEEQERVKVRNMEDLKKHLFCFLAKS